jgi:hypothetical protein
MKLLKAQIRDYRSVNDSTPFEVEPDKTIAVGANEAGKTALLRALQTVNPPDEDDWALSALRDYPRARYTNISTGAVDPSAVRVAVATFTLDPDDIAALHNIDPIVFADAKTWELTRYLDNQRKWWLPGVPDHRTFGQIENDLTRLKAHLGKQDGGGAVVDALAPLIANVTPNRKLVGLLATNLDAWLESALPVIDEDSERTLEQFGRIRQAVRWENVHKGAWKVLIARTPVFVYFSQIYSVRPRIHLANLAQRQASNELDDEFDFGNLCLLDLLGFSAKELSDLASAPAPALPPNQQDQNAMAAYHAEVQRWQDQLDDRQYRLNAASVTLTEMVREVWNDDEVTLNFKADGQYLKVVVQDEIGVEVELDQRSDGFRWLVSFFVVFRAQAKGKLNNAILLLDEPGLSLHALKQQQFRKTVSMLAADNQIIYTTHSPFMVGTDELDHVRVVEMTDRKTGTKVHSDLVVDDPRSIYPLQAALGYELAQSLFGQKRNLVCEGLTDMWYLEGVAAAMREGGIATMRDDVAVTPAQSASKVVYYCALLRGQKLKVAALLDSDAAGDQAATQDELVRLLKGKEILRTKDHYSGAINKTEIEDLLRETLISLAKTDLGWDVSTVAAAQPARPIVDIFTSEISGFSKYRLAKAFLRWLSTHSWSDLTADEQAAWASLTAAVNKALA